MSARPAPVITSTKNPLVKRIRTLATPAGRARQGRILLEGLRLLDAALAAGARVELLLYDPALDDPRVRLLLRRAQAQGARLLPASRHVVAACSTVETTPGLLGIAERPRGELAAVLARPDLLLVVADGVQDPGNLGTIIRIADAAGAGGVVVTAGSVDPFNPKALRATMGSIFHLPVAVAPLAEALAALRGSGVRILLADQRGAVEYTDADYRPPVAVVLGSEAQGPDPRWRAHAAATVRIPLYGRAESLNVAVAAGLLLYEARRR